MREVRLILNAGEVSLGTWIRKQTSVLEAQGEQSSCAFLRPRPADPGSASRWQERCSTYLQEDKQASSRPAGPHCCGSPAAPSISLPREPSPYSSFLPGSPCCWSSSRCQVLRTLEPSEPPQGLALNLGGGVRASPDVLLLRPPPTSPWELNHLEGISVGGTRGQPLGRSKQFLVEPAQRCHFSFLRPVTADEWD